MAWLADVIAHEVMRDRGDTWATDDAVTAFDESFSLVYVGLPMNGVVNAYTLDNTPKFVAEHAMAWKPFYSDMLVGQRGFKNDFTERDSKGNINYANDQTHHFATFFSAGINSGIFNYLATGMHNALDNKYDIALGNKAYELGKQLRSDPSSLSSIGSTIRTEICDP